MYKSDIGGVGWYFWYTPPERKVFENTAWKLEKNWIIHVNKPKFS